MSHDLDDFGHLIPARENRRLHVAPWTSSLFSASAPEGRALIPDLGGDPRDLGPLNLNGEAMVAMAAGEARPLLRTRTSTARGPG